MGGSETVGRRDVVREFLTELHREVQTGAWRGSYEAQAVLIDRLNAERAYMTGDQHHEALSFMAECLDMPMDRMLRIAQLERPEELRRALKVNRATKSIQRLNKEDGVYPTDGWLGLYLLYTQGSPCPTAWHFWCGVAALGAACRRNFWIDWNQYNIWPNHYIVILGPSGTWKSVAIRNAMVDLIDRLNGVLERDHPSWPQDKYIQTFPEKATPEFILQSLQSKQVFESKGPGHVGMRYTDSCGIVAPDEFVTLFGKTAYHSDLTAQITTALWECPYKWSAATISRGTEVLRNVSFSIVGGSTLEWIRKSATEDMFQGGFMGRCIFINRPREVVDIPRPDPFDPVTANYLAEQLAPLTLSEPREMRYSLSWDRAFADWNSDNTTLIDRGDILASWYARKNSHLKKLSAILALSEGQFEMRPRHLEQAIEIFAVEEKYLPGMIGELMSHEIASLGDYVLGVLRNKGGVARHSDLYESTMRRVGSTRDFRDVIDSLTASNRLKREPGHRGQGVVYRLREHMLDD